MSDAMPEKRWLPVAGYEGLYEVSDQGRVRSRGGVIVTKSGVVKRKRGRLRRQKTNHHGYKMVGLKRGGVGRTCRVHMLVLEAFVGPRPSPEHLTRHLNNVRDDNRAENLCWGTAMENSRDMVAAGRQVSIRGELSAKCLYSDEQLHHAITRIDRGCTITNAAREIGIDPSYLSKIRRRLRRTA